MPITNNHNSSFRPSSPYDKQYKQQRHHNNNEENEESKDPIKLLMQQKDNSNNNNNNNINNNNNNSSSVNSLLNSSLNNNSIGNNNNNNNSNNSISNNNNNENNKNTGNNNSLDTDPSVYQLLQNAIQLIYQTRSGLKNSSSNQTSPFLSPNNTNDQQIPDIFNIKQFEGGLFQSKTLSPNDLGPYIDKEINLEFVEINEINRDLTLWCEHIISSPLKIDIFLCTFNEATNDYKHTLLERWMFTFTPIDFTQQFNKNLLISSSSSEDLNISLSPSSTPTKTNNNININSNSFPSLELSPISSSPNATTITTQSQLSSSSLNHTLAILNKHNQLSNNSYNDINSSILIKSLYYTLSSMPLFQSLKKQQQMGCSSIVPPLPKIKYGINQHFPPPFNFKPEEFSNLVKLNFPQHETSKGSISLSVQFPNISMPIIDGSISSIVIYPSRSCSSNLICHNTNNNDNNQSISQQLQSLPTLKQLIQQKQQSKNSNNNHNHIINENNSNSSNNNKPNSQSTSPSSAPISIPKSNSPSSPSSKAIDISSNLNLNDNDNSKDNSKDKIFNINNIKSPFLNNSNNNNSNNNYSFESFTSQFSPASFKSFPYSPTSPPLHSFSLLNSPNKNQTISPPSSPYRVGHRPLFFDGLSPSSISSGINSSANSPNKFMKSPSSFPYYSSPSQYESPNFNHHHYQNYHHHHHMTFGSFQESLLTGNMSNTPSTKFDGYLADLGVSGKDYIPPHKKISFSALYYHIDHDTPYVADIDIGEKGFRVPPKGLIQLTLFNPHNTPIKTFLVNFDLSNMGSDSKTFIRQKIISFNNNQNSNSNNTNNNQLASSLNSLNISSSTSSSLLSSSLNSPSHVNNNNQNNNNQNNNNQNILKYAIHLRFICLKKRKYYLYKNIRVVFPNRVPDEMEKLKIVYEYPPEPKYFPFYK